MAAGNSVHGLLSLKSAGKKSRYSIIGVALSSLFILSGCAVDPDGVKFSEAALGVAASPRILNASSSDIPRGGGRYSLGKPYKIAGKWYHPKLEKNYDKVGMASWYGPAFHGRMTANGEIFDQFALSAAHPTMPLPSYARVTNLSNGRSVTVRVNDRGPFAHNRIIDLSRAAAEALDFISSGTAKVRVQYIDKARLDGQDEAFLLASLSVPGAKKYMTASTSYDQLLGVPEQSAVTALSSRPQKKRRRLWFF